MPDEIVDPVERKIREAMEAGEFDGLPGAGRPIPDIDEAYDPGWWAKRWLQRARDEDAAAEVHRLIRRELPLLRASRDRAAAERRVEEINALVAQVNERLPEPDRIPEVRLSG